MAEGHADSKVFKAAAWRTDHPLLDRRTMRKLWDGSELGTLVQALIKYEDDMMHASVRSKRHTCTFADILNPSAPYPQKMLKPSKACLADAFIEVLSPFLTGFRVLDSVAHWVFPMTKEVTESNSRLSIRRELPWPGKAEHWDHMQDLEKTVKLCISLLKKVTASNDWDESKNQSQEAPVVFEDTALGAAASKLVRSRKRLVGKVRAWALVANLEGTALGLNTLLRGTLDIRSLSDLEGAEGMDTELIVGPLLGALFIDPIWALTTVSMRSFCDEEIMVASTCLGSHRPQELEKLNEDIFKLLYQMAMGKLEGLELVKSLLSLLESARVQDIIRKHRHFYRLPSDSGGAQVLPSRLAEWHPKIYEVRPVRREEEEGPDVEEQVEEVGDRGKAGAIQGGLDGEEGMEPDPSEAEGHLNVNRRGESMEMEVDDEPLGDRPARKRPRSYRESTEEEIPLAQKLKIAHSREGRDVEPENDEGQGREGGVEGDDGGRLSPNTQSESSQEEVDQLESSDVIDNNQTGRTRRKAAENTMRKTAAITKKNQRSPAKTREPAQITIMRTKTKKKIKTKTKKKTKPEGPKDRACVLLNEVSVNEFGKVVKGRVSNRNTSLYRLKSLPVDLWHPDDKSNLEVSTFTTHHEDLLEFFNEVCKAAEKTTYAPLKQGDDFMVHTMTEEEYKASTPAKIGEKLGEGKVIVIVECECEEEEFSLEQLSRVSSLDRAVDVQDQSIIPEPSYKEWERSTTLRDMFNVHLAPENQKKALNALSFPNYSAGPKDAKLNLDERIWNAVNFIYGFRPELFPRHVLNWFIVGLLGACHGWHGDSEGFGTFIIILSGVKWWVIARNAKTHEKLDFFLENPEFHSWAIPKEWDVEAILLKRGTRIIMPPGMLHAVFTLDSSVCAGGHYYLWETMEHTLHSLVRSLLMGHQVVNTEEYSGQSRQLLLRMMGYLHDRMILNDKTHEDDPDLPRLETTGDWIALSAFFCLIKLFNVVSPSTYRVSNEGYLLHKNQLANLAHQRCDANELSIQERRDIVWSRGLLAQAMPILSDRYGFDFEQLLFEPMLGHYAFHIDKAFKSAYPPDVTPVSISAFHLSYVRDMFHKQLKWVVDTKPRAKIAWVVLDKVRPIPKVMKYCDWTAPKDLSKKKNGMVTRLERDWYFAAGLHAGDVTLFNALKTDN